MVKFTASDIFHREAMVLVFGFPNNAGMVRPAKFRPTFIRAWRKHRRLTLERLAERLDMTPSHLSMLERGERGYTQETLEAVADALQTDVASLLMRDASDSDGMWSLWDQAKPGERRQIVEVVKAIRRTQGG